jgi:hypothetical protein
MSSGIITLAIQTRSETFLFVVFPASVTCLMASLPVDGQSVDAAKGT